MLSVSILFICEPFHLVLLYLALLDYYKYLQLFPYEIMFKTTFETMFNCCAVSHSRQLLLPFVVFPIMTLISFTIYKMLEALVCMKVFNKQHANSGAETLSMFL